LTSNLTLAANSAKLLLTTRISTSSAANAKNAANYAIRISRRSRANFQRAMGWNGTRYGGSEVDRWQRRDVIAWVFGSSALKMSAR
jgi:hypothetical protein